ncbi:MAG: Kae1-associated serine/threonine protein kinase [Nanoarchaeota archaeon]|nr:Kae1-associated serine/threonine protein kinase [Nanoarchaeota archaeon]
MKELWRGAEAVIYELSDNTLLKNRVRKGYRIKELDEPLRRNRTRKEFNLLKRAASVINVPKVSNLGEYSFEMEYVKGIVLRDYINSCKDLSVLFKQVGELINKMHEANIVHGDLTTSNMILRDDKVYFVDFSLGDYSNKVEDKAVDLHLIKQALIAKHNKFWKTCFDAIISNYKDEQVLERLKSVEKRGRKKQ